MNELELYEVIECEVIECYDETPAKDSKRIKLTPAQYSEFERALQWPEDLAKWDSIAKPTRLSEILI